LMLSTSPPYTPMISLFEFPPVIMYSYCPEAAYVFAQTVSVGK
jgi:hypothetical protein